MSNHRPLHGGEIYSLANSMHTSPEQLLDFSSNANMFAHSITAELVHQTPYPFLHYPDTSCLNLRESLSAYENTPASQILPGNGATELIWLFLQNMSPRHVLFIGPIFSEYVKACNTLGISYSILAPTQEERFGIAAHELHHLWESTADLVVLCTPNNPAAITYPNFHTVLSMIRAPRLLIDNSYREFLYDTEEYKNNCRNTYLKSLRPGVSLFTLGSFTKFFCSPGIRLGYLLGDKAPIEKMAATRPSWMVNPFAQQMGIKFLENISLYRKTLNALREAVVDTGSEIRRIPLFSSDHVFEGPGFLCCGLHKKYNAERLYQDLLGFGIIIRCCDTIPGMPPGFIRLQARPSKDREKLIDALENITRQLG